MRLTAGQVTLPSHFALPDSSAAAVMGASPTLAVGRAFRFLSDGTSGRLPRIATVLHGLRRAEVTRLSGKLVVVRKYNDELTAQVAAATLEANGIPARVLADTAGGLLPNLSILFPVRLVVREEDAELAREVLDAPTESSRVEETE